MSTKKASKAKASKATVNRVMLNGVDIYPMQLVASKVHKGKLQATVNILGSKGKTAQQIISALEQHRSGKRTAVDIFNCCVKTQCATEGPHAKGGKWFIGKNISKVTSSPEMAAAVLAGFQAVGQRLTSEYKAMLKKATAVKAKAKAEAKTNKAQPVSAAKATK